MDDRDVAKIFNDLLECWLRGAKYIMKKEALGLEQVEMQRDFFEKSSEMEDILIMVLTNQMDLDVGKTLCQEASTALDTWLIFANRYLMKQTQNILVSSS